MRRDGTDDQPHRNEDGPHRDDRAHRWATLECKAVVERYDGEPNQCTIFPVDEDDRVATWITAEEPAFVDLNAHR